MKRPGYKPGYCKKMLAYFAQPPQRMEKKVAYYPDGGVKSEEPVVLPAPLPTFQAFAESPYALLEMSLKRGTLEDVFLELTEAAPEAQAAEKEADAS